MVPILSTKMIYNNLNRTLLLTLFAVLQVNEWVIAAYQENDLQELAKRLPLLVGPCRGRIWKINPDKRSP